MIFIDQTLWRSLFDTRQKLLIDIMENMQSLFSINRNSNLTRVTLFLSAVAL